MNVTGVVPAANSLSSTLSLILVVIAIGVVLYTVFRFGRFIVKLIIGILINSVVGFVVLLLLNYFLGMGIPLNTETMAATAVFGLPAVGTMVILKLLGGTAVALSVLL
ncbi:MAG: pro-sigmaK processing inhibitor BofA family protein [Candidatus Micrarchaeota archaeon]|nr:pro-sigmaK processing inhibitor BofA family protein [Candidatus Micrarchaeota archaeon]